MAPRHTFPACRLSVQSGRLSVQTAGRSGVKDDTEDEKVNHVKYETFDVGGCASIMEEEHHVYQAFNAMEHPTVNGQPTRPRPRARARARAHDHARTRRPSRQGARPGSACRQQREDGRQTA